MRGTAADHLELLPSPSPPSSSSFSSHFSPGRHYYVAVDRLQFKMVCLEPPTLILQMYVSWLVINWIWFGLWMAGDTGGSSRSGWAPISLPMQYSDLAENERAMVLEKFRHCSAQWNQNTSLFPEDDLESSTEARKSCMIVVTDACLPLVTAGEAPLLARVLINYELPTKKETYLRRMSTCLAADGIVINMVVGGEVVALKGLEENSGLIIAEMPINISEIL
ncbi:unnamed protein product [Musa acuminata subsp. malaccensis]|uniref:(wild Malaysian banana) hypothetical protein n=1 Tax=Musa acuminata subsp. malaccensis TaxID=214687 RepID=A0A8D7BBV3_MUSAM|nr:unnamed protein product [Musa acuminata subsp. malaccensis]